MRDLASKPNPSDSENESRGVPEVRNATPAAALDLLVAQSTPVRDGNLGFPSPDTDGCSAASAGGVVQPSTLRMAATAPGSPTVRFPSKYCFRPRKFRSQILMIAGYD